MVPRLARMDDWKEYAEMIVFSKSLYSSHLSSQINYPLSTGIVETKKERTEVEQSYLYTDGVSIFKP